MLQFSKYQGLGNDFLIFDNRSLVNNRIPQAPDSEWIQGICNRNFGVGADGIIIILPPIGRGDLRMRIFNADGKEAEMCGNGIRCLTKFLGDSDTHSIWNIETLAGIITSTLHEHGAISIDMGEPLYLPNEIPTKLCIENGKLPTGIITIDGISWDIISVGMGNPHAVILVSNIETIDLNRWGNTLEQHFIFPKFSNIHFTEVLSINHVRMKTWERGVGITLACGTGACAVLIVTHTLGLTKQQAQISLPGGSLDIHWQKSDNHLVMTGEAKAIFDGVLTPEFTPAPEDTVNCLSSNNDLYKQKSVNKIEKETIICSKSCMDGCLYPDNCFSRDVRSRVSDLIANSSLDEIITLTTDSIESRIQ
uniref:Diaminopimelate epimerase n=1 Tax=Paulinella micropora TaxID=1928728 RepID=A0A385HZM7_9EUKA|nr:diaminopimelate epimerase [Paulinella micropora]AXY63106.1 diaminopimelate epimerase [Paulinella micropora]